jgi:uncharacterized repeat protein (TIGR01451 family)
VDIQGLDTPYDFGIEKSAPNPALQVSQESDYTLTVVTTGTAVAVEVKEQLPAGLTYVSATGTGWSCSVDGSNLVTCSKSAISDGTPETITVKVKPDATVSGQSVTNYASVGTPGSVPEPGASCTALACDYDTSTVAPATFTMSKSAPSPTLKVAQNSVYTLTVTTNGDAVPADVKDLLPTGLTYVSATGTGWSCAYDSGSRLITCDKASMSTGTAEEISVTVTPTAASVGQSVTNYASAGPDGAAPAPGPSCTTADCDNDVSTVAPATFTMDKSAPSPVLKVGENSVYTLTVTTDGAGVTAEVKDQLPSGLTYVSATGTGWSCSVDGSNLVTCDKASISTGTAEEISVTVTPAAASVGQSVTNYASAGLDGAAPTPGPSCSTADCDQDTSTVDDATFTMAKSAPSPALKVGDNSVYTLTVTTDGSGIAAEAKDQLPVGLTYVSATGTDWSCSVDGSNLVTCSKASISTGTSEEIAVTVTPTAASAGQSVTNYASAGPDGAAPAPGPSCTTADCASDTSDVADATFTMSKSAPSPALQVGENSVYTLTVTTDGSGVAAEAKDQLPAGLTFVSATGTDWSCSVDGSNLVTCSKASISTGTSEEIAVTVTPTAASAGQSVTNYASAGLDGAAPAPGPSCTTADCDSDTSDVADPTYTVTKSAPSPGLRVGSQSVYTLTVTTDGDGIAAEVKDQLPAGLTYVSATGTGWNCSVDGSSLVTCSKESISTSAAEEIEVTVVTEASALGQDLTNYASAGPEGGAPEPGPSCDANDCDSSSAEVAPAGYTLAKSAPVPQLQVHQNSVYTLTVTTDGVDVPAEVKDQLPAGLTFVSATGTGWSCSVDGSNLVTCSKTISSGAPEQIAVTVTTGEALNAKNVTNYASAGPTGAAPQPTSCTPAAGVACANNASTVADIREEIKKAVEDDVQAYLGARLDQLIGSFDSQSRLQRFRNTACGVSRDLSLSGEGTSREQNIAANGTFSMKGGIVPTADVPPEQCSNVNIWAQLDVGYVDGLEDSAATGGLVTVGAEYLIADNFLAGARLSMDYTDASFDSEANSDISGYGWLAGPYISAEIANNLFLDGFLGYGTSWNDYGGNYEGLDLSGDFTTQRIAGYLNLSGTYQTGAVLLTPLVGVSYGKEWSDSFDVSNDIVGDTGIDGQNAELGRLKGRIEAGYLVSDYADERMELFLAPQVTYDFVRNAGPDGDQLLGDGLWRGGLEGGFRFSKDQFGASLIVGYDGVGVSDWNAYRGQLQLNYTW